MINVLTPETARKSSSITIRANHILVYFKSYSKTYGVKTVTKTYKKTPENLKIAKRYA